MRISDWSSDVCSSDLLFAPRAVELTVVIHAHVRAGCHMWRHPTDALRWKSWQSSGVDRHRLSEWRKRPLGQRLTDVPAFDDDWGHGRLIVLDRRKTARSEEHTSELQSLMRISYAVC